jgi:hypothetical protein
VFVISKEYEDSGKLFFTNVSHILVNLPIFLKGKIWLNFGIRQTLGFYMEHTILPSKRNMLIQEIAK